MKRIAFLFGIVCAPYLVAISPDMLDCIYQVSTLNALDAGVFDAKYTYRDIMKRGTLGIGTVDNINGEMIAVDGHFYHILTSGKAQPLNPDESCPFARLVHFNPQIHFVMTKEKGWTNITQRLLQQFPSFNIFYAVKIQGVFSEVKMRVLREVKPPYSTLDEAKKDQNEFTLYDVQGTIVGFYTPKYLVPTFDEEFDFSFLSSDGKTGGHIIDFSIENVNVLIQPIYNTQLILPPQETFQKASIDS